MKIEMESSELYSVIEEANAYREEGLLQLMENGILIRMHDWSNTALYAGMIPKDAMESYDRGEFNEIGVRMDFLKDFLPDNSDNVTLTLEDTKMLIKGGDRQYRMGLKEPDSVAGVPDQVPELDLGVTVENDPDWLLDFAQDSYSKIHNSKDEGFYISARDGALYLWANGDVNDVDEAIHWEDFDDYDTDWANCVQEDNAGAKKLGYTPEDDHIVHTMISTAFLRPIKKVEGTTRIEFDDWTPMKIVTEKDNGIKHSWMIPPRLPTQDTPAEIPDRIIRDRHTL